MYSPSRRRSQGNPIQSPVLSLSCKEYLTKPKVSPASSESRDDCGDAETLLGFLFLIPFPYNHLNPSSASFCEERSSQSNHAGKQRPCATQSELSLSCSGALNARSECSITGPEPRACTSTGCTGSTATSLQHRTTVAIPRKEMMMTSFHFGTFRLFSVVSFRPRQKQEFSILDFLR